MHRPLRLAVLLAAIYAGGAHAQARPLAIPAQPLPAALTALATQSGIQLLFNTDELRHLKAAGLEGTLAPEEALRRLLAGSGYTFQATGQGSYVVRKAAPAAESAKRLPEMVVSAENERSYKAEKISVAGKMPLALREIPNSVSVLTRAQMDDQNMVTVWDAMSQVPGVQAISNDITQGQYHSRGAALDVQHDGAPSTLPLSGYQQFDLAMYERIEILRGPSGLVQGSGAISGTVNFVRKRAQKEYSSRFVAGTGSWNNNRLEADVTGALNEDGSLRGRAVASYVDRDFFYNRVHDQKSLAYATLEYDFSPATTASVYVARQDDEARGGFSGLPSYTDGRFLNVSRSFNPYPDWNRSIWDTTDVGGDIKHTLDNGWTATLKVMHRDQNFFFKDAYPTDGVNPLTNTISSYARREFDYNYRMDSVDAFAAGSFELFGRQHKGMFGANYSSYTSTGVGANPNSPGSAYLKVSNVALADPPVVAEPTVIYTSGSQNVTTQSGYYGQVRFNLADPLTFVAGARLSDYDYHSRSIAPSPLPTDWKLSGKARGQFTPYAGLLYDVSQNVTLYASYSDIFAPQTGINKATMMALDPRVGKQYEVGTKTEWFDRKLAANFAVFEIRDTGRQLGDNNNPGYYIAAGELESKGWEAEVVGQPSERWHVSGAYTYLDTEQIRSSTPGLPISFWYPKRQFKLWNKVEFGAGPLEDISLGFGVRGASQSASGVPSATVAARSQNSYAVVDAQVGYKLSRDAALTFGVKNLFDSTYYTRLGGINTYNTYGDPRNYELTLRLAY